MSNVTVINAHVAPTAASARATELIAKWDQMYGHDCAYSGGLCALTAMALLTAESVENTLADPAVVLSDAGGGLLARRASETRAVIEAVRTVALR